MAVSADAGGDMTAGGYFGQALVVDATTGSSQVLPLPDDILRAYIGGSGLGAWLLHALGTPGAGALDATAPLAFVFSPLVGTPLTTSAKFAVVAKSPLTGMLTDALASSQFAIAGKLTGHDAIVIRGRAPRLSVLLADGDGTRLLDARHLAGRSAAETDSELREQLGRGWRVAAIGPAGERGIRYATISHDGRHAGRGGLGAVMGAKNLKAIAVRAAAKVATADPAAVLRAARDLRERSFGPATAKYRELGTLANLLAFNAIAALPTRNFQAASFEGAQDLAEQPPESELAGMRKVARSSCASCTIGCEHIYRVGGGKKARVEYENVFALGPMCGVSDPDAVLAASARCDELGIDTISAGGTIAWAMECAQRGLIDAPWLRFGDSAALLRALDEIGAGSTALGSLLGEGSRRASGTVGGGSAAFAPHVKGLEMPGYEPRTLHSMALGLAVNARGADHNRSGAYEADLSGDLDRLDGGDAHVAAAIETEDRAAIMDSLILCKFLRGVFTDPFGEWAALLASVTGWDVTAGELRATARRIVLAKRVYNIREGWQPDDDWLPDRLLNEPLTLPSGREATLTAGRLRAMIDAYYKKRGLDPEGRPDPVIADDLRLALRRTGTDTAGMAITAPESTGTVTFTIDGREVTAPEGATIWQAAKAAGIDIPVLCHDERFDPVGVCRMCVVDVGAPAFAASCVRACENGMQVTTSTPELERSRVMLTEMLVADQPPRERDPKQTTTADNELLALAARFGLAEDGTALPTGSGRGVDLSSPVIAVDHDACILCDRCVRACDDIQGNDVIGRSGKGYSTHIAFDLSDPMGASSCVSCGECVAACPTGALTNKPIHDIPIRPRTELDAVDTVCPYCGVGCALTYYVDRDKGAIAYAEGREQPGSHGRLCVKGRYGWDYAASPQRLTVPLIRREDSYPKGALSADVRGDMAAADAGAASNDHGMTNDGDPKGKRKGGKRARKPGGLVDYDEVLPHFREATWEEALDLVARRLTEIYAEGGPAAMAGFGSAKCSNEEAYLFQKLIRTGFHTNNVDHCTRLCHASSVAALFEGIGSGAVSTTFGDVKNAGVAIVTGSNSTANHPVASTFFKQARRNGTTVIYVDPRADKMADHADIYCQLKPGTDVAFYNGVMHEVIRLGLTDEEFIANRTSNYEALKRTVADYPPERAEQITGVPADTIRRVARAWGEAKGGIIFWGMGISQHTTGTDNARCLIAMCAITGNVGKQGAGLHPLRGQNNVQGASDMGLIPMYYPNYQKADDPGVRARFETAWGTTDLDPEKGLTTTEIIASALAGGVRGMYMLGENPFLSDPNINKVRKALAKLDFLVVQDIFLTETAEFADVILPASSYLEKDGTYTNTDRRVQLGRKVLDPPGQARVDWEVVQDIAQRIGLDWHYETPRDVFEEMVTVIASYKNLSYDNLGLTGKLYPNPDPEHSDGTVVMFGERFNTNDGLAHLVPAEWLPAKELPDEEYPFVLNTGRMLEHWHTGSMTRRSYALDAIAPTAQVYMHPGDAARLGLGDGDIARVSSRRGTIELAVKVSHTEAPGNCFIPFHFREAAANLLTTDAMDPIGKIPEYKFCAVRIEPASVSVRADG